MKTPRIEELEDYKEATQLNGTDYYRLPVNKVEHIINQAHQAGIDEAVDEKARWEQERDALFQETNVKKLLEQMEKDLLEYGQYHDPDCLQMSEWADPDSECDCEIIKAMRSFATEWVGKTNEMWVTNLKNHRKHCGAYGNKDLTQRKNKVLGKP